MVPKCFLRIRAGRFPLGRFLRNVLHGVLKVWAREVLSQRKVGRFSEEFFLKIWAREVFSRERFGWFLECFDTGLGWGSFLSEWVLDGLCKDYLKYWAGEI